MTVLTPEEQDRQELFNEYVSWRLEMIHSNPEIDPSEFSNFEEWCEVQDINISNKKPRIKKRNSRAKKIQQTA